YKHTDENHLTCNEPPLEITEEDTNNFIMVYTYSESKMTKWSSEWDYDLESATEINIQWTGLSLTVQTQETPLVNPKRSFFTKPTIILGSLLPVGCIFLQLPYILNRIWIVVGGGEPFGLAVLHPSMFFYMQFITSLPNFRSLASFSTFMYFGYTLILVLAFFLFRGT
ncbi:Transmembrane 9 superfamily member 2, partial [Microtus ochrogaster]